MRGMDQIVDQVAAQRASAAWQNQYARPDWKEQLTKLSPEEEAQFLLWADESRAPITEDYDMRGYWKAKKNTKYGAELREKLFPTEDTYFKANPNVGGMAAEDNRVILNPYSPLKPAEKEAVRLNEASRIAVRRGDYPKPQFDLTPAQQAQFKDYSSNPDDVRQTFAARVLSGDPSAQDATPEQRTYAEDLRTYLRKKSDGLVLNPNDGLPHYPDTWKTPLHQSFSGESVYSNPDQPAPTWNDKDQLLAPDGKVLYDERKKK